MYENQPFLGFSQKKDVLTPQNMNKTTFSTNINALETLSCIFVQWPYILGSQRGVKEGQVVPKWHKKGLKYDLTLVFTI